MKKVSKPSPEELQADAKAIAEYLATHGVKKLKAMPARELGESTPGWRREAERKAEGISNNKRYARHQQRLKRRLAGYIKKEKRNQLGLNDLDDRCGP